MSSYPSHSSPPPVRPLGSGMAVASLVLGIVSVLLFLTMIGGLLLGSSAIVLGVIALRRSRKGLAAGRGMARTGVVLGVIGFLLSAALIVFVVSFFRSDRGRAYLECFTDADGNQSKIEQCQSAL